MALSAPNLPIETAEIRPWSMPLGVRTARGAMAVRRGWHIGLGARGHEGWGDVAPWPGFGADHPAVEAALQKVDLRADALPFDLPAPIRHGIEQARLDLCARMAGEPLARSLHREPARRVGAHRLVADAEAAREAVADGAIALKIKVGADPLDADESRVCAIRAAAPVAELRLDANGAWDRPTAARAIERLAPYAPAWIEQPLPADDLEGFAALRRTSPLPLALDESVAHFAEAVVEMASVIVIKPMFVGGLQRSYALARAARRAGARVCITHALESTVGRLGALHLAAALEGPSGRGIHGLAGPGLCAPVGGFVSLPAGPGLGYAPGDREAA